MFPSMRGPGLDNLVRPGSKIGLSFMVEELRAAHRYDWGMRYVSYGEEIHPSANPNQGERV